MAWVVSIALVLLALLLLAKNVATYSTDRVVCKVYLFVCELVAAATLGVGVYNLLVLCGVVV